jgi:hypothetical protein
MRFDSYTGTVRLNGATVHLLLDRLAPFLDGTRTLDELLVNLSADQRAAVQKLVSGLVERDVIRRVQLEPARFERTHDRDAELAFIGYFNDDPETAYAAYRARSVLVLGAGTLVAPMLQALSRAGLNQVRTAAAPAPELCADADVVFHLGDASAIEEASVIERAAAEAGAPVWHAMADGDRVWLGHVDAFRGDGGGLGSAWRRLRAMDTLCPGSPPAGSQVGLHGVAARLVQADFRAAVTAHPWGDDCLVRCVLSTLESVEHRYRPHPFGVNGSRGRDDLSARVRRLQAGPRLAVEEFSRRAITCVDEMAGVFGELSEGDYAQSPLNVCRATVSDPVGLLGRTTQVVGSGPDFTAARHRGALAALATYASLMVDPRRLVVDEPVACLAHRSPESALAALREDASKAFVQGFDVADGSIRLLDAAHVFPVIGADQAVPYRKPSGVAAGFDWQEALTAGIAEHCLARTAAGTTNVSKPAHLVDLDALDADGADAPVVRYRDLLASTGRRFSVYDLTGTMPMPTFLCDLDGLQAGSACALNSDDALLATLEQALLTYQSMENNQPDYRPPVISPPVAVSRDSGPVPLLRVRRSVSEVVRDLAADGHRLFVVPLDHDPAITDVLPYLIRVVSDRA